MSNDRQELLDQLKAVEAEAERLRAELRDGPTRGDVALRDSAHADIAVGVLVGTIVYGHDPTDDERRRLAWYLDGFAGTLRRLPLRGISEGLDRGDGLSLPRIYVMLAVQSHAPLASTADRGFRDFFIKDGWRKWHEARKSDPGAWPLLKDEHSVKVALPTQAVTSLYTVVVAGGVTLTLLRDRLATESLHDHPHLVLLGDPGSGKSTFLCHLAWSLAQRGLGRISAETKLDGWMDDQALMPIILPLRQLAGAIVNRGATATTVFDTLRRVMQTYCVQAKIDDMLNAALHNENAALVMFDGLDEVPAAGLPGVTADRLATLSAVRAFTEKFPNARIVLTCRTRAFDEQMRAELGWPVETLAPFTLGQVRHFLREWYGELVGTGQVVAEQAERYEQELVAELERTDKLRMMSGSPLLLTMMALVLYNRGGLPRDRPQLYEAILDLLLGKWDEVRGGESLANIIGDDRWGSREIRPLLNRLSYIAHRDAASEDGRGSLSRSAVRDALIEFFEAADLPDALGAAQRMLGFFIRRSGLIVPDDAQDSFVFAHLALQEHCTGCYMLQSTGAAELARRHRADDRWHEPIMLGLGAAQDINPALVDQVLTDLIDREEGPQPKAAERWQRDLILAAEIGEDRDWTLLSTKQIGVRRLQRDLRSGLVALLADASQPLPTADRVRAGFLLSRLGDPRFPVTIDEWQHEVERAMAGDTSGYLCKVEAGTYIIGSVDADPDAQASEKPQHTVTFNEPFWIARYPITNSQWEAWAAAGGQSRRSTNDSNLNHPNQPVVDVSMDMCTDYCERLNRESDLSIRLPTEFEWEAAARDGDARRFPWGDAWEMGRAATAEDRESRGWQGSVPVGCYPAGSAPCGALDLAGNVWEWTMSEWQAYPGAKKPLPGEEKECRVLRGGGWNARRVSVRCTARDWIRPVDALNLGFGFRVVVAPRAGMP
jgi:formylglycine-generating enzyme required for sulfatase activity